MSRLSLKQRIIEKELTIGSWLSLADTDVAEMMAKSGFDWLVIDQEHSSIGLREMSRLIQVIDLAGSVPLVRVGVNDPLHIKQALDSGAKGIIVPMVNSVDMAKTAVQAAHYPPKGTRGVGLYRAQGYGESFDSYRRNMADDIIVVVQIEHYSAIDNIRAIMKVDGVDAFLVGPYDLSGSYGKPGDFNDNEVVQALNIIEKYCVDGDKSGGIHVVHTNDDINKCIEQGYKFIAYGSDMIFLSEKIKSVTNQIGIK